MRSAVERQANEVVVNQEKLLLDHLRQIERHRSNKRAVHIHLSKLRSRNRQSHHARIAASTFETHVKQHSGQIFNLSNGDIVFVCLGSDVSHVDDAVSRVRHLFGEDPLSVLNESNDAKFCSWHNLETDYRRFRQAVEALYAEFKHREQVRQTMGDVAQTDTEHLDDLTPALLGAIENSLAQADLSNLVRRQPICAVAADARPKSVLHEVYVSITQLQCELAPNVNLRSDRWLFHRLTHTLDRRMLSLISRSDDSTMAGYISINLNVSTVLSPEFIQFDEGLRTGARGTIVLEFPLADVFGDMDAFAFARDFVRERGYRPCIQGITLSSVPFIDRDRLGVDFLKVDWDDGFVDDDRGREIVFDMVRRSGDARTILSRCESDDALQFGKDIGVTMFQGYAIDAMLAGAANSPS
ncbi:MAG: EAL domain-containing protein [Alphaproteobacteria bacterium]